MTLKDLLEKGHIPRELPPPFTSIHYAKFFLESKLKPQVPKKLTSRGTKFSCPKVGLIRKTITLTNPAHQTPLFECINDGWPAIQAHYQLSDISYNQPISLTHSREHGRSIEWTEFKEFKRQCFRESFYHRYELRTDIAKYYPSIYTHSIPWALHTKEIAKTNKNDQTLLGNKLDKLVQATQYGQTVGIPIGPDSSVIIGEIIGTQIDRYLREKLPNLVGYRYVDDMYFYFNTQAEAELCLKEIQHIFKELELQINTEKTCIKPLPCGIEDEWVITLRTFPIRLNQIAQANDIYSYFSLAFDYAQKFPTQGVLAYVVRRLKDQFIHHKNFPIYESMLYKVIQVEGSALPDVLRILLSYSEIINKNRLKKVVNELIKHAAPRGHDYEVSWSLWYAITFSIYIDDETAQILSQLIDPISRLLTVYCSQLNLLNILVINTTVWTAEINQDSLFDDKWIFAYEIAVNQWLLNDFSYINNAPFFGTLRINKISFFDPSLQIDVPNNFNNPNKKRIRRTSKKPEEGGYI